MLALKGALGTFECSWCRKPCREEFHLEYVSCLLEATHALRGGQMCWNRGRAPGFIQLALTGSVFSVPRAAGAPAPSFVLGPQLVPLN